jgi:hypothetical protein
MLRAVFLYMQVMLSIVQCGSENGTVSELSGASVSVLSKYQ